jgi:hypothetical protein
MGNIQNPTENEKPATATTRPWLERGAMALLRGERIGLAERDHDEQVAILKTMLELIERRPRRRRAA